ncbi:hypothetical protein [Roseovarius marisflavi]|uniref:hypothetical protein n=1 Tax=Roseovarius marisflavi TaxID=1054996 RepID=UPI001FE587A5|nr:hypothetical protein [Roseovarius marisflavi]
MSDDRPVATISADGVDIRFAEKKHGLLQRLMSTSPAEQSFTHLNDDHRDLLFAIADLRNWQDQHQGEVDKRDRQADAKCPWLCRSI